MKFTILGTPRPFIRIFFKYLTFFLLLYKVRGFRINFTVTIYPDTTSELNCPPEIRVNQIAP